MHSPFVLAFNPYKSRNLEALMKQRDAPELKLVAHPAFDR